MMLGVWLNLVMAGEETLPKVGGHKPHRLPHGGDPLRVHCRLLGGSQPHIDTAWGSMFRAHGHSHEHQTTDFLRIVQAILQGDTGFQRVPDQHQVVVLALGPQPSHAPIQYSALHSHRTRQPRARARSGRDCREKSRVGSEMPPHIPLHAGETGPSLLLGVEPDVCKMPDIDGHRRKPTLQCLSATTPYTVSDPRVVPASTADVLHATRTPESFAQP
jgi:hypothetical protein